MSADSNVIGPDHDLASKSLAMPRRSIVISEDNPILAGGVLQLLKGDVYLSSFNVTSVAGQTLEMLREQSPDILILDPWQYPRPWQAASAVYLDLSKTTHLVGYCPEVLASEARALGNVGFRGVLPKTTEGGEFVRAISSVAYGGTYIHDKYAKNTDYPVEPAARTVGQPPDLTERETDVLRHVALGSSTKEIAAALNISSKTVDTYKTRANQKLNLRSRSDIVRYAIQLGWMN